MTKDRILSTNHCVRVPILIKVPKVILELCIITEYCNNWPKAHENRLVIVNFVVVVVAVVVICKR